MLEFSCVESSRIQNSSFIFTKKTKKKQKNVLKWSFCAQKKSKNNGRHRSKAKRSGRLETKDAHSHQQDHHGEKPTDRPMAALAKMVRKAPVEWDVGWIDEMLAYITNPYKSNDMDDSWLLWFLESEDSSIVDGFSDLIHTYYIYVYISRSDIQKKKKKKKKKTISQTKYQLQDRPWSW